MTKENKKNNNKNNNIFDTILTYVGGILSDQSYLYIHSRKLRHYYSTTIRENSNILLQKFNQAKDYTQERIITQQAVDKRNLVMNQVRSESNLFQQQYAKFIKEQPKSLEWLENKYAHKMLNDSMKNDTSITNSFDYLDQDDKKKVLEKIVESSGSSNKMVNTMSEYLSVIGQVMFVLNIVLVILSVLKAQNKKEQFCKSIMHTFFSGLVNYMLKELIVGLLVSVVSHGWLLIIHIVLGCLIQALYVFIIEFVYDNQKVFGDNQKVTKQNIKAKLFADNQKVIKQKIKAKEI